MRKSVMIKTAFSVDSAVHIWIWSFHLFVVGLIWSSWVFVAVTMLLSLLLSASWNSGLVAQCVCHEPWNPWVFSCKWFQRAVNKLDIEDNFRKLYQARSVAISGTAQEQTEHPGCNAGTSSVHRTMFSLQNGREYFAESRGSVTTNPSARGLRMHSNSTPPQSSVVMYLQVLDLVFEFGVFFVSLWGLSLTVGSELAQWVCLSCVLTFLSFPLQTDIWHRIETRGIFQKTFQQQFQSWNNAGSGQFRNNSGTKEQFRSNSGTIQKQFWQFRNNSGTIRDAIPKCHPGQMQDANLNNQERFGNNSGTISKPAMKMQESNQFQNK